MRTPPLLSLVLALAAPAFAESAPPATVRATVPFELVNNHLLVPVSVNGSEPFHLILDTGMPAMGAMLYDSDRVQRLKLPRDSAMRGAVGGAGGDGSRLQADVVSGQRLSVGKVEIRGAQVIVIPVIPELVGYHDGVIGRELFANFVVEANYDERVLTLHDRKRFEPPDGAIELPVTFRGGVPYTTGSVTLLDETVVPLDLVVDIGASHALSLNGDSDRRITLPEGAVETILGRGVSGEILGHVGRVASFTLAGRRFENMVVSFPESRHQNPRGVNSLDGNLGNGVMKRFNVAFDYRNKRLLLEPNRSIDQPFEFDMSGMRLEGASFRVEQVVTGSPAAEAGIRAGDVVVGVDGRPTSELDLWEVRERLMQEGREAELQLDRDGRRIEVRLRLRRLV